MDYTLLTLTLILIRVLMLDNAVKLIVIRITVFCSVPRPRIKYRLADLRVVEVVKCREILRIEHERTSYVCIPCQYRPNNRPTCRAFDKYAEAIIISGTVI